MLSILIVDDEREKVRLLTIALLEVAGIQYEWIEFSTDIVSAKRMMKKKSYDVVLLDINLPKRADAKPEVDGGLEILRWLRATGRGHRPQHLIATSAYDRSQQMAKEELGNVVWSLIPFAYDNEEWKVKIKETFQHIIEALLPPYRNDGASYKMDLGIIVALDDVELKSVLNLPGNWQPCSSLFEDTRYYTGSFKHGEKNLSVVAVAAPNKGMPFAAVAASKLIAAFRPKFLIMTGICAGITGRVKMGDAVFADPSWDWGSGKIVELNGSQHLQAAPYQFRMPEGLRLKVLDLKRDVGLLARIRARWSGPKPESEISIHVGAVASGAAVLQSREKMRELVDAHKDLKAIEMEIFATLCAAEYAADPKPQAFAVKAVCDFGDEQKGDSFQEYAAFVSAQIVYEFAIAVL